MTQVYSADRERRLRLVVRVAFVLGAMLVIFAVWVFVGVRDEGRLGGFFAVMGLTILGVSTLSLRALPDRDRNARTATIVTGAVVLVAGLLLAATIVGFGMIILGIAILVLALLRDEPEAAT